MQFFCPVCQQTSELTPETTLTTKLNQEVYKARCPTCQQDLARYGKQQDASVAPVPNSEPIKPIDLNAQAAVDEALKEFGSVS